MNIAGGKAALWSPHCARIQPAKLVRGLASVVEKLGVSIFEGTEVTEIRPHEAVTKRGSVHASYVIRALEGFTASVESPAAVAADEQQHAGHSAHPGLSLGADRVAGCGADRG